MTLSALTQERQILTPYQLLEQGIPLADAYNQIRRLQREETFYCPHCFRKTGQLNPVRFRGTDTEKSRPHFFHAGDRIERCQHYAKESEAHMIAKAAIASYLQSQGLVDVKPEFWLDEALDGTQKRRPDIMASYPNGAFEAHEIQISPINSSEMGDRTNDIQLHLRYLIAKSKGLDLDNLPDTFQMPYKVCWYLFGRNHREENISWALNTIGVETYRLTFEGENKRPRWKLDIPPKGKKKPKAENIKRDRCTFDAATAVPKYPLGNPVFALGQPVTQSNGRGWTGKVVEPPPWAINPDLSVYVEWEERKTHEDANVRKRPVISHLSQQLKKL